ncbi:succinyl-diaminopimelate desuccinylase [Aliidongia dinghuensis]|uniref:Succinyl-diaminopimelate desuccinylase n=1 Tax=Aliidongia dinghuensis TaxID=1867774 RepID=A0A8J3E6H2_9PROT|nr:M20/M25/M40 family metallo-hydrolase [Aliidongia dinghuensis]GGF44385.1 succinyl-diaminopimelate desuccinylase [Aliidongia dinghuensis]
MGLAVSARIEQALRLVDEDEAAIEHDLARLIAVDTSFPPGDGYGALADLAEALVAPLGFACRRVSVPEPLWSSAAGGAHGERINLIAERGSGLEPCSLYFHVDTVPAGDGWSRPPFALTRVGDRLYGRGAADMKGTIAATLAALRALDRAGAPLRFEPRLLFCTDEEGGLYPGIRYLAEQGLITGHLLSFNGGAAPRIWAGCFGSIDLLIRVRGRGAHSGDPVGGINAVEEAIPLLNALIALKAQVEARTSAMPSPPHYQGRPLHARLTIAALHGGQKGSSLPAQFEILVNRRYTPEEDFTHVLAELEAMVRDAMAPSRVLGVETHVIGHLAPVSDPTGPHWPRWQAALARGFGFAPEAFRAWGSSTSSDMGFVQQAGIREILLGGLGRPDNNTHAPDEFTTMTDVTALARAVLLYLSRDFG